MCCWGQINRFHKDPSTLPLVQTQEMWSFLVPAIWLSCYATEEQWQRVKQPANALLMAMFLCHYFNRCGAEQQHCSWLN